MTNAGNQGRTYRERKRGGIRIPVFVVSPHRSYFNIRQLGREEAFRRALELRADHERAVLARKEVARV